MNFVTLTDYLGDDVIINFDHVHYYREANKEEQEHHPTCNTRIETDCFTFYVREFSEYLKRFFVRSINASNDDV